jgi:hypothetical protein
VEALRVNADYEIELFQGRRGAEIINHSLEFLAFFLEKNPVFTNKSYSVDYLNYVEKISGHYPALVQKGPYKNWWGPLVNLDHERWMNSKVTTSELNLLEGWSKRIKIIKHPNDLENCHVEEKLIAKNPFGMSGVGLKTINNQSELSLVKDFPCILEPLLNRCRDFSHYCFADGSTIVYENLVDDKFQYRGTVFRNLDNLVLEELSFFKDISLDVWTDFRIAVKKIQSYFSSEKLIAGFSIDSFIYTDQNLQKKIYYLCEVNYRRTMGVTAFELAKLYGKNSPWALFLLTKIQNPQFLDLTERLKSLPGVILFSPPDVRFQMFLFTAKSESEGKTLLAEFKKLLPECQFTVDI